MHSLRNATISAFTIFDARSDARSDGRLSRWSSKGRTTTSHELKEREHANWTGVASGWRKNDAALTAAYAGVTQRMLQSARVGAGDRVLDVACGGGEPAISAAEHVGPGG